MKIICDDKIPFLKGVLEQYAQVEYYSGVAFSPEIITDADALIIRTRTTCNEKLLKGSNVKFIGTATIGFDHIDVEWVEKNGIRWTNAPGCNSGSVKQYIAASFSQLIIEKGINLEGKTIGIVGVGNVGSKVAQVAKSFGMNVLLNDPPRQRKEDGIFVSIDQVLAESDIITFHVPLNRGGIDNTYHLFNDEILKRLKPGVIIINSSRGEVTKTSALLSGLEKCIVSEAIIDVWENEPEINQSLLGKVFIGTPHIAGYSLDGKANGTSMVVQALSNQFRLPLTEWIPKDIPPPKNLKIDFNCSNLSDEEALARIILNTYPIKKDDNLLKSEPETFEKQRGNYPVRREFEAFELILKNAGEQLMKRLKDIGFIKISNS